MTRILAAVAVSFFLLFAGPAFSQTPPADSWKEIEKLLSEDRLKEAAEAAARVREAARKAGDEDDWMRGLIQETQLRTAVSGVEEGYRVLEEAEWPRGPVERAILHLYTAELLQAYNQQFSWRINQRERIEKEEEGGVLDLERATRGEIYAALLAEAAEAWSLREQLSAVPLDRVHRYVIPNQFPAEVRGTLRDAVSYLIADVLADSAFWSVEEAQDLPRADLPRLIAGTVEASPADAAVHPLARMAAVLGDLEAWHTANGHRAATLEARRERLRLLGEHFDKPEDRQLLRADLEEQLAGYREISWWSMGMATLGDFVRQEGDLAEAQRIAREGHAAWPDTVGGDSSLLLAEEIEAPSFDLSAMASDGLGRRSLLVRHKNLRELRFRAYAVDVKARLSHEGSWWRIFPDLREIPASTQPVAEWRTELPPTPDFEFHQTYVIPSIERPGAYLVVATPLPEPKDPEEARNRTAAVGIILGDLVLSSQTGAGASEITVLSGSTGEPIPGVQLRVVSRLRRDGAPADKTLVTGPEGRVRIPQAEYESAAVVAWRGEEVAYTGTGSSYETSGSHVAALFLTDRAIYRPQQTVFWKVLVYRRQAEGEPAIARGREIQVRLIDPNGQAAASVRFTTNEFGTAAGSFTIPPGRPLGSWHLEGAGGMAPLQVEEYKRPTFEVTLDDPAEAVRLGRSATFSGKARYYFGLPVTNGEVRWRVVREPVWTMHWWGWAPPSQGERVVATGTAALDDAGAFRLTFLPAGDESVPSDGVTWRFRIEAEVTDAGGETRQAERQIRLGQAAVEARIALEEQRNFLLAQVPATVSVQRTSLDGVPRPGEGSWTLVALRQPERALLPADRPLPVEEDGYHTPGDRLRPRHQPAEEPGAVLASWEDGERIASGKVRHQGDGRADIALPGLAAGAYRLRYETVDEFGTRVEARREIVVAGRRTPLAVPIVLVPEQARVRVGGTIRLLAHSGLPDQPLFLEIYRAGRLRERRTLRAGQPSLVEIPVRAEDRGGFGFKLFGVRDHQLLRQTARVFVPWDNRELSIELSTFRDRIRPGARETWTVTVRSAREGKTEAAAAEVLALMYDRSLDLFGAHTLPDPLALFPDRTHLWEDRSSLGEAQRLRVPQWNVEFWSPPRRDRLRLPVGSFFHPWIALLTTPATPEETKRLAKASGRLGRGMEERRMSAGGATESLQAQDLPVAAEPPPPPPPPPPPAPTAPQANAAVAAADVRRDFRETALWEPRLLTGPDGSAKIEFTVPDSVTSWNFWVQAVTRDLSAGSLSRRVESVKELMVRPYLPRFLREGDRAELKVAVDNASQAAVSGEVELDVIDPETEESLLGAFGLTRESARLLFQAKAGGGTTVTFPLTAPRRIGPVAFRVTAVAPGARDGELRPLPILPARMRLAQSRSVALRDKGRREMTFPDLARDDDPTRIDEQLVVTVDGQLFYGLLAALPYLVDYPYECTEQTLNRFVSTGILTGLFDRHPAVARMAEDLAKRETPLETWDAADPNRKMALEETPWLVESQGLRKGEKNPPLRVLDPRVANAEQASALAKLAKAQLENGAFPWWPGGPASPYMTVYLLYGFAKAREFGVEVPEPMVQRGWAWLGEWVRNEQKDGFADCACWQLITFLNYTASASPAEWTRAALPDEDRRRMLEMSWEHRFQMTPYLKALLSLTLHRMGRKEDGRNLLTGLLSSATTTPDEGTFWTEGEHGWVWYEDAIETHAFVLRAAQELLPEDPRRHGLVQWLFLNKQLSHWSSTRDTAEVIYAVSVYLEREKQLGTREEARVRIGARTQDFVFEPDRFTGKENRVVVPGEEVGPAESTVVVEKETPGFLFATSTWHFSTEKLPEQGDGQLFQVERRFFRRVKTDREVVLQPLGDGEVLHPGDELEVHLRIRSRAAAEYVHLRDPRPAGLEPDGARSGWRWGDGAWWYEETRDSGMNFFFESLPAGEYTLKHRVRANLAGTFRAGPATIQSMYAPEHTGYSAGREVRVE